MDFCKALTVGALLLISTPACAGSTQGPDATMAIEWNEALLRVAEAEDNFLTLKGVRAAAMMHLAMHDALNAIEPRYERYSDLDAVPEADPVAASAQAAFQIAAGQYPEELPTFRALLSHQLGIVGDSPRRQAGIEFGRQIAASILEQRREDGWDAEAEYDWHPMGPGVYAEFREHSGTPEGFVFGAGWASATPFFLESAAQFRSPSPPEINSAQYASAFDEVKELGSSSSTTRSEDQTHLAMWWKDFVESSHNRLARDLARQEGLDLWQATRLFALLNSSVVDAYISVFENKFHYNHWRPYTAIRWAANDGNPDTDPDETWTNTHDHTYAFPSYPSAHGCACASAMEAFKETFGNELAFEMRTARVDRAGPLSGTVEMDPPVRSFQDFDEAALECALSRVYLGIHFRYDSIEGNELGRRIGRHVVSTFLRPIP